MTFYVDTLHVHRNAAMTAPPTRRRVMNRRTIEIVAEEPVIQSAAHRLAMEEARRLAGGEQRRVRVQPDGTVIVVNGPDMPVPGSARGGKAARSRI